MYVGVFVLLITLQKISMSDGVRVSIVVASMIIFGFKTEFVLNLPAFTGVFLFIMIVKLIRGYLALQRVSIQPILTKEMLRGARSEYCWKRTHNTVNQFPDLSPNQQLNAFVIVVGGT